MKKPMVMPMALADIITEQAHSKKTKGLPEAALFNMERMEGIEPSYAAWEAAVLPLNYTRNASRL
jgi:hypothetical protein